MVSNAHDCIQAPTYPTWWGWKLPTHMCWAVLNTESNPWPQFSAFIHFTWTGKCTYYRAKIAPWLSRHRVYSIPITHNPTCKSV